MKTKFTDGFNPIKTRAHSRMSNAPLLVTEPFLPKTFLGDVSRGRLGAFRRNVFMSLELYPKKKAFGIFQHMRCRLRPPDCASPMETCESKR